ncbi:MAG: phosphoribosylformylglycinamidine synthase [Bacteroidetes bacterium]|nr:phosphoribosylformylglycinamidine synthase [Bacteroidota bacterium]
MILYFRKGDTAVYALEISSPFNPDHQARMTWLLGGATLLETSKLKGFYLGPRKEMITPWSTNAVEIAQNMGVTGLKRIEQLTPVSSADVPHDRMLERIYADPDQNVFAIDLKPEPIRHIADIRAYSTSEGLALSDEEIEYLESVSNKLGRPLTDSEVFGFSQVNSEHCRHKIFNGTFIIDGKEKPSTLFQLIKKTAQVNPGILVSAYKDNVAFVKGPVLEQFAPVRQDGPDFFQITDFESVISLKAETHNFPTTVEPFNGAATGSGGEIRDRLAGGKGSLPLAGTAVYMTSYPRLENNRPWEQRVPERKWLYQTPAQILIKASDGASDFGNKFGQPLINGSVLTFEHFESDKKFAFDKVIMLAGGVGFGRLQDSKKQSLQPGDKIVLLGGDNYRIGMGGGAVSSVGTGEYGNSIELNAIQRSNPEMQKRVMNAIRAMVESDQNPVVSIHDHGAGGHLNCFSELLEETGGEIKLDALPVGDPTLSDKELISNESQERMGLAMPTSSIDLLKRVSDRERAPMFVVGEATGDHKLIFSRGDRKPVDLEVSHLFGSSPKTILNDTTAVNHFEAASFSDEKFHDYLFSVLSLEAVACKDWLTNKVDRSVTGKVATQQTCGSVQLPLNNLGVMALDFVSNKGVATALGHAPAAALVHAGAGSRLAVSEALLNLIWTPLTHGLKGISLSANWMWPAKNQGENARLYEAVQALSDLACSLGINVPTGKDSLSMTQKYPDGSVVVSPGTVIVTAVGESSDIRRTVSPAVRKDENSVLYRIDFSDGNNAIGASSLCQVLGGIGGRVPDVANAEYFIKAFGVVQELIKSDLVLAGHDVSSGGLITTLLEMCFSEPGYGMEITMGSKETLVETMFSERPSIVIQVNSVHSKKVEELLHGMTVGFECIGKVVPGNSIKLSVSGKSIDVDIDVARKKWFNTSFMLDSIQRPATYATQRAENYINQPLVYNFGKVFDGSFVTMGADPLRRKNSGVKAAIIREKGVNGDREMAYALYLAGFDVKDVHMTDLISGREDLREVNMIVFVGGFSNSDVLGSAKGWAGAFLFNPKAKLALDNFYKRSDTLSLGVCNGCQLMMELGLIYPGMDNHPVMHHNGSGRFESAFVNVSIPENNSVMLSTLAGQRLGVWLAHGEGKFTLSNVSDPTVAVRFSYDRYPGNPNDSDLSAAGLVSRDGRHLAMMPHLERSIFPWNWPYYPAEHKKTHQISPWIEAFKNAYHWVKEKNQ